MIAFLFLAFLLIAQPAHTWAALGVTIIDTAASGYHVSTSITSNTLTGAATGNFIDVILVEGDNDNTAWTITNTGTAITWGSPKQVTNTASQLKLIHWTGIAGATPPGTITTQTTTGADTNNAKALIVIVQSGQHATTPLPAGNLFLVTPGNDLTQAITPTSTGSNLWMVVGDWSQTNTFSAGTNNTLAFTPIDTAGAMTVALTRPTTQPRPDASAFTLAANDSTTAGKVIGIAWEVQADGGGGGAETFGFRKRLPQ